MSEKVKLPRDIAKDIEKLRKIGASSSDIIYTFAWDTDNNYPELVAYAAHDFDTFLIALVNGYEVEETPYDRVKKYFDSHNKNDLGIHQYTRNAIIVTLNLLEIKIPGVNADE